MPTYTIHAPPLRAGQSTSDPERFLFVRDGFYCWAFLFGPVWMLVHRLWLVLLGYVVICCLVGAGIYWAGAPNELKVFIGFMLELLVGFEAATLRRWTLTRHGWTMLSFVVGDDAEGAERRFFSEWTKSGGTQPEPEYALPVRRGTPSRADVIGLFPEPKG